MLTLGEALAIHLQTFSLFAFAFGIISDIVLADHRSILLQGLVGLHRAVADDAV